MKLPARTAVEEVVLPLLFGALLPSTGSVRLHPNDRHTPQQKPALWEDILMFGSDLTGERSGPPAPA